eukprot:1149661-Pelagomonas_calceolata.AAC.3
MHISKTSHRMLHDGWCPITSYTLRCSRSHLPYINVPHLKASPCHSLGSSQRRCGCKPEGKNVREGAKDDTTWQGKATQQGSMIRSNRDKGRITFKSSSNSFGSLILCFPISTRITPSLSGLAAGFNLYCKPGVSPA